MGSAHPLFAVKTVGWVMQRDRLVGQRITATLVSTNIDQILGLCINGHVFFSSRMFMLFLRNKVFIKRLRLF